MGNHLDFSNYTHLNESVSTRVLSRVKFTNTGIPYAKATGVKTDAEDLIKYSSLELSNLWKKQVNMGISKQIWREHGNGSNIAIPLFKTSKLCLLNIFGNIDTTLVGTAGVTFSVGSTTNPQSLLGNQVLSDFKANNFWCREIPYDSTAPNTSVISDIAWFEWFNPQVLIAANTPIYLHITSTTGITAGDISFDVIATTVGLEFSINNLNESLMTEGMNKGKDYGCIYPFFG